jgi:hypothetical protein
MILIHRERVRYERRIGELDGEIRELKGMLGATLQLLGGKSAPLPETKSGAEIVELPQFLRRDDDAA